MKRLTRYFYENCAGVDCEKCGRRKTGKCKTSADCAQTIADRLAEIEDILGDEYDLDRLRELLEADREGRCVVYLKGFPVASTYLKEGGLYIRETSGVISHEEYRAALKGERDG